MDSFKGKYERVSAEKYDEFLKVHKHRTGTIKNEAPLEKFCWTLKECRNIGMVHKYGTYRTADICEIKCVFFI